MKLEQNPHQGYIKSPRRLEIAIGAEIRRLRSEQDLTVAEISQRAGLSHGMVSKIERGLTSPSLATLQSLSEALSVPVTSFFRTVEEQQDASYVPAGQGIQVERQGTRAGHQYQLLGHVLDKSLRVEPYLITLSDHSDVFPIFKHGGLEFIHLLDGELLYRHGGKLYPLKPGDSLFFNAEAPHGPEKLVSLPAKFICVISYPRDSE